VLDHLFHKVIAILAQAYFSELERERLRMVSLLAHDLKAPVTSIQLLAELLVTSKVSHDRENELVDRIRRAAINMSALIENMLEYGRLKAGRVLLDLQEVDLSLLASEAGVLVLSSAEEKKLSLTINGMLSECWSQLPQLVTRVDRKLISRALINYLSNAVKHAKSSVALDFSESDGSVIVSVSDDGPGISSDRLKLVFEDYYVVGGETAGTGLGLSSVRMIAKLHNGECGVESEVNKGSRFYLRLPKNPAKLPV
jgi:signal transduction histidine kinase